ncbi:MAG TPA: DUF167 domain-containing protein [Polyangiaceae bacterium]|nr:DUF167 domain-containing protein [Polyangiaceae bacterium]
MGKPTAEASVRLTIKAKPRASQSRITAVDGLNIEARLAAPPVDGAANAELLRLLADALRLRGSALRLVGGQTSKHKVVEITGLSAAEIGERLNRAAAGGRSP